jgi:hypothetical protein
LTFVSDPEKLHGNCARSQRRDLTVSRSICQQNCDWSQIVPRGINLVVTCAKRKLRTARESLQLRSVDNVASIRARARLWIERLRTASGEIVSAETLYGGDHWSVVRDLAANDLFGYKDVKIWVCSAGYGLIPLDSRIHPYSATFSPGHPDSVFVRRTNAPTSAHAIWWSELAQWEGPRAGYPRSIAALAQTFPDDLLLVVMSETYLLATAPDLQAAVARPSHRPDRFAILCSGVRNMDGLSPYLLPSDARLQHKVGGALASLNIRLARLVIDSTTPGQWSLTELRSLLSGWLDEQPDLVRYDRAPMTDDELGKAIRKALKANPETRPTPLLRKLRDSGRACEHSRFVRLFHETARKNDVRR